MESTNLDTDQLGSEELAHDPHIAEGDAELRVAAAASALPLVRAVVSSIASQADYDVDAIADLRLAVDEACSSLIHLARGGSLQCRFSSRDHQLVITSTVSTDSDSELRTDTFSWRVLTTLVDDVSTSVEGNRDGARKMVHVVLRKSKVPGR